MLRRSVLLIPVLLACADGQGSIQSGTIQPATISKKYSLRPTGLASSETAQVNLFNIAQRPRPRMLPAPSCSGKIILANAAGTSVGSAPFTTTCAEIVSTPVTFSA